MGDLEQSPRAWEGQGAEVGPDAVGQHRHARGQGDPQEVVHLGRGEELRLVDQEAGDVRAGPLAHLDSGALEDVDHVVARGEEDIGPPGHAEPGDDLVVALGVEVGLREQDVLAPLLVVVGRLEQRRALAGVHRSVAEIELGH
jgi:hypothetical protein